MVILRRIAIAALLAAVAAGPASANAIDGSWCADDDRRFDIDGAELIYGSGATADGEATDRSFTFTAPEDEANANSRMSTFMIDEDTLRVIVDGEHFSEDWNRCPPVS